MTFREFKKLSRIRDKSNSHVLLAFIGFLFFCLVTYVISLMLRLFSAGN